MYQVHTALALDLPCFEIREEIIVSHSNNVHTYLVIVERRRCMNLIDFLDQREFRENNTHPVYRKRKDISEDDYITALHQVELNRRLYTGYSEEKALYLVMQCI